MGFTLSEQDLRKIVQTCQEDISKVCKDNYKNDISAKLKDGSIIGCRDIDEIFKLGPPVVNGQFLAVGCQQCRVRPTNCPWYNALARLPVRNGFIAGRPKY
jgi:hypothetical protein